MPQSSNSGFEGEALGLLETRGLIAAIEGTDAMLKAANVRLLRQEKTVPALITSLIVGETAAVRSAIDAGQMAAERVGAVVSAHVIPRPAESVRMFWEMGAKAGAQRGAPPSFGELTVVELRRLAREIDDQDFSGRTISKASKQELLAFLESRR